MNVTAWDQNGKKAGTYDLPDRLFDVPFNADLVQQALEAQSANSRAVIAHTKGRGEVRGGGRKPWMQKGTGRARHGSIRSPIWVGGGVTFGPRNTRNYSKKINKKQKQKALAIALSSKVRDGELAVVNAIALSEPKTKIMAELTRTFLSSVFKAPLHKKVLIVIPHSERNAALAARNLPKVKTVYAEGANVYDLLATTYVLVAQEAIPVLERTFLKGK